ncbi:MAG: hypothetical protein ACRDYD_11145 [Acidimicrobiales bacterium]
MPRPPEPDVAVTAAHANPAKQPGGASRRPLALRLLVGFGRFWWDFLVGETPELFVGVLVVVGVTVGLTHGGARTAAIAVTPLLVIALLVASALRGRART